jgi:magnesium chelatase family protein
VTSNGNPRCPCGYRSDPRRACKCPAPAVERYMAKISGPLMDRIDLHIEVPSVPFKELAAERAGLGSEQMRAQVVAARDVQRRRLQGLRIRYNAQMGTRQLRQFCPLSPACLELVKSSVQELGLSARAHDKIRRVARTIADLDGSEVILPDHLSEAINYRLLDRNPT